MNSIFDFNYSDYLNVFDIMVIFIIFLSIIFAFKNGLIKSIFNLSKWILIIFLIRFSFEPMRPFIDKYINNSTIADITIFIIVFIGSYIILSSLNRVLIGIIQPKKSGAGDHLLGSIFGLIRGYTIVVLFFTLISSAVPISSWPNFLSSGSLIPIIKYGENVIETIPVRINNLGEIIASI